MTVRYGPERAEGCSGRVDIMLCRVMRPAELFLMPGVRAGAAFRTVSICQSVIPVASGSRISSAGRWRAGRRLYFVGAEGAECRCFPPWPDSLPERDGGPAPGGRECVGKSGGTPTSCFRILSGASVPSRRKMPSRSPVSGTSALGFSSHGAVRFIAWRSAFHRGAQKKAVFSSRKAGFRRENPHGNLLLRSVFSGFRRWKLLP